MWLSQSRKVLTQVLPYDWVGLRPFVRYCAPAAHVRNNNVLDLSNSDLLVIANSIDAVDSYNESVEA